MSWNITSIYTRCKNQSRWHWYMAFLVLIAIGCSRKNQLLNEENPFYQRGMELSQNGRFKDAITAYENCLRHSPKSYKAYLQLAMIYDDQHQDYPQAIVYFRHYLKLVPDQTGKELGEKWMTRSEKKYFEELNMVYGNPIKAKILTDMTQSLEITYPSKQPAHSPQLLEGEIGIISPSESPTLVEPLSNTTPLPLEEKTAKIPAVQPHTPSTYYTVQKGDTLTSIAKQFLGHQRHWNLIYEANNDILSKPEQLKIGQRLIIPLLQSDATTETPIHGLESQPN